LIETRRDEMLRSLSTEERDHAARPMTGMAGLWVEFCGPRPGRPAPSRAVSTTT
jgi:hypothetical protein